MSSAYGDIARPAAASANGDALAKMLPHRTKLASGAEVVVERVTRQSPPEVLATIREMLNHEIRMGNSYPQELELDEVPFLAYFLSHDAFAVTKDGNTVLGAFYIKPNYPGRCSHVCNGGFLTNKDFRKLGVGTLMGRMFIKLAPLLGYRASVFNLVFANNVGSVTLWRNLGFTERGRIPGVGRLKKNDGTNGEEYVDAIMFYYDFTVPEEGFLEESDDR
ncbi:hypothetical protein DFJ74DRAFT_615811 [Hyaloraphidium curvatum]|nr:hypothetical protein DFJ74DRAFT_615811 [Hyaloraphidium curvatum]